MAIENKIDKIQEDVSEIKTHLAVYNEQLKVHIKRTNNIENRLVPIEKHVIMASGLIKFIALMASILTAVEVIMKLL